MNENYVLPAAKAIARQVLNQEKYKAVERFCSSEPGARILDINSGNEDMLKRLRQRQDLKLYGVSLKKDLSRFSFGQTVVQMSELPYSDGFFDTVVTVDTVALWGDIRTALREIQRVLCIGGSLVCVFDESAGISPQDLRSKARMQGFFKVTVKIVQEDKTWLLLCER